MPDYSDYYNYTAAKLISFKETRLAEIFFSEGYNKNVINHFSKKIAWFEETNSRVSMYLNGVFLKEYSTFSDYYGYEDSVKSAKKQINELKKAYKLKCSQTYTDLNVTFKITTEYVRFPAFLKEVQTDPTKKQKYKEIRDKTAEWLRYNRKSLDKYIEILNKRFEDRSSEEFDRLTEYNQILKLKPRVVKTVVTEV